MNRTVLDRLLSASGAVIALVLLLAGVLMTWAHVYVHDQVRDQLVAEKIQFPAKGSDALKSKDIGPYLNRYAGQQLETGAQAKAWADHYIAVHLREMTGGKTYSELSAEAQAHPKDAALAAEVDTVFRGETLRGLLLNAYAFDTMATLALIGAVVAYAGAVVMAVLALLGLRHARRYADAAARRPSAEGRAAAV
ncbi:MULTISPECIES: hypothetical protein [unclassified Curtobacterium]|uniref:hypothetical protein n=1 Tax=unclassified Curtobacterium TaxID=257496 RepID=UPI000DA9749B|nr:MULTISPECIES: hypothetical protein [unclassified Curtobacterium]PZE23245.1 hypothetical protein DEI86_14970 [Curtobacterium sp. MCBD17_028]PZE72861.1 hypothetical protein DEI82_14670 [Curtobacterium sp. MCBD17_019]PZF59065.1 hypothetical protein DEI81_14235 [Curtobacterium sp. MCBD17_013]WIB63106.1 hypothetical protein DEI94_13245 [Curtobacterium sp. MCBD17_040]WIB66957.1 hypothetical protein DEI93_13475 [Curtobacterium sp. MCBD17_035]